jgi:hypothetical protein
MRPGVGCEMRKALGRFSESSREQLNPTLATKRHPLSVRIEVIMILADA